MTNLSVAIGILAAVTMVVGHVVYILQIRSGKSLPNATSWTIWEIATLVIAIAYFALNRDVVLSLGPFATVLAGSATFAYSIFKGKLTRPRTPDILLISACVCTMATLEIFKSARGANLMMAAAVAVSFVPTVSQIKRKPESEKPAPWLLWDVSQLLTVVNAAIRDSWQLGNLAVPGVYVVANAWMVWLSWPKKGRKASA